MVPVPILYFKTLKKSFAIDIIFIYETFLYTKFIFYFFGRLQNSSFQALLPVVRERIIEGFSPQALDLFNREFDFFDKVTSISGALYPLPKEERRAGIRRYLFGWINEVVNF